MLDRSVAGKTDVAAKLFWVATEMEDGTTQSISVRSTSAGEAFRQVKSMAGVRRVGKVADANPGAPSSERVDSAAAARDVSPAHPRRETVLPGQPIVGPRVVIRAHPGSGEQPFRHLQAPPERPAPPVELAKPASPAEVKAPTATEQPPQRAYRTMKSRRRGGEPYVLQRGRWTQQANGKRSFAVEWEKGFQSREAAEAHQEWLEQMEREIDSVDPQAA